MGNAGVRALLGARSAAIIGASDRNPYAVNIFNNMTAYGFPAEAIFPVNPRRESALGRPCWPSIADVPHTVDLAVIAVPAKAVPGVMESCAEAGVPAAVIVSEGFAESGPAGFELQRQVRSIAASSEIVVCGPNTLGVVAPLEGLGCWAGRSVPKMRVGRVAAVFQSSGLLNLTLRLASYRNLGVRMGVSVGNALGLRTVDYLRYAVDDDSTDVVLAHIESLPDPVEFIEVLRDAQSIRKPVILLHYGKSRRGQRAVMSHTGALASPSVVWEGIWEQFGVTEVSDLDQALETTIAVSALGRPSVVDEATTRGVGLVTISGGDCTMLADLAEHAGVRLADLSPKTVSHLQEALETQAPLGNPLDVRDVGRADRPKLLGALETLFAAPDVGLVAARLDLPHSPGTSEEELYSAVAALAARHGKPFVVWSRGSEHLDPEWMHLFSRLEVPFLSSYSRGLRALQQLLSLGRGVRSPAAWETDASDKARAAGGGDEQGTDDLAESPSPGSRPEILSPEEVGGLLAHYGIQAVPGIPVASAAEAVAAAEGLGYPVVLKVEAQGLAHKSDVGGVILDVRGPDDLQRAYETLMTDAAAKIGTERVSGARVEPMLSDGVELILGFYSEPEIGPVVLLGTGGVLTELIQDRVLRLAPLEAPEAYAMVERLRGSALLAGFRGRPRGDVQALVDAVTAVSRMATERRDVEELDINPLLVRPVGKGVVALDAMATRRH